MGQRKGYFRKPRASFLGNFMTSLRVEQGLTLEDVARAMGRSKSYICKMETSERPPDAVLLTGFARACKKEPEYLLAHVPQLQFNLLSAITSPADVPEDPLQNITEDERQELTSYLAFLRLRRGAGAT